MLRLLLVLGDRLVSLHEVVASLLRKFHNFVRLCRGSKDYSEKSSEADRQDSRGLFVCLA